MASSFKNNNSQRGKPYAFMLLLAFGAAILGVMVLHKLREKRIFTLLVKEKDQELLTLHLLFQREQEFNKDARKKIEEMKNKVYSLRSQKLELDRRLLEMESTIASMKDERKVIESTLEEKKNEIKMLTEEGMNSSSSVNSQVAALQDMIKMKEVEIDDLKLQLNRTNNVPLLHPTADSITGVDTRQHGQNVSQLLLEGKSGTNAKAGDGSQANGSINQENEHRTNETGKADNMEDDDEPRMRREAALYKWVDEQRENTENGGIAISTDENQEQVNETSTHDNPQGQEGQGLTSLHRGQVKLEKSVVAEDGLTQSARRTHFRTKRNRRSGDSLYSVPKETDALSIKDRNADSRYLREASRSVDPLAISDKRNQTRETANDGQASVKEAEQTQKEHKRKSQTEDVQTQDHSERANDTTNETAKSKMAIEATVEENVQMQIIDGTSSQTHETDANRKLLKMQNMDLKTHENDNEQDAVVDKEQAEAEGSEDSETHEPEIDREDIRRFAESDTEEEEAEEAAEETEF